MTEEEANKAFNDNVKEAIKTFWDTLMEENKGALFQQALYDIINFNKSSFADDEEACLALQDLQSFTYPFLMLFLHEGAVQLAKAKGEGA